MDGRRKELGRRIKRARRARGYRSQKAFADAIGVHESSVANAEIGSERVGDTVYGAIEAGLGWPEDATTHYLATGDARVLLPAPSSTPDPGEQAKESAPGRRLDSLAAEIEYFRILLGSEDFHRLFALIDALYHERRRREESTTDGNGLEGVG